MTRSTRTMLLSLAALVAVAACRGDDRGAPVPEANAQPGARAAAPAATPAAMTPAQRIERGRYLVETAACHDCHTPLKPGPDGRPAPDPSRALSGHPQDLVMPAAPALPPGPWQVTVAGTLTAWSGPWGTSFTANLTPDPETGIGAWTEQSFIDTIRTGRRMGKGRPILPPMPIPVYQNFTDEDLAAIFAYLRTIPAISNKVPEPRPPAS